MGQQCCGCLDPQSNQAFKGEGKKLGTNGPKRDAPMTAEEQREARKLAAEKRMEANKKFTGTANLKNRAPKSQRMTTNEGLDQKIGEVSETEDQPKQRSSSTDQSRREVLAEAAQRRIEGESMKGGISKEKAEELRIRREKDELIGKIEHYYNSKGKDVPFGLPALGVDKLKSHLEYAKNMKA